MALISFRNLSILLLIFLLSCLMVRGEKDFELLKRSKQKFMFKHSFKPPMIVNSKGQIPFWDHGGGGLIMGHGVNLLMYMYRENYYLK